MRAIRQLVAVQRLNEVLLEPGDGFAICWECAEAITASDRKIDEEVRSMQPRFLLLLDCILFVSIVLDLRRTLRTGVARGKWGSFTRERQPKRFLRYVYASYVMIAFCVIVLFWVILKPGWWTAH